MLWNKLDLHGQLSMNLTSTNRLNWLKIFLVITLVLGIFFRFVNLDQKVYRGDESFTSRIIAGYTMAEINQEVSRGQVIKVKDLYKYQKINSEKGLVDTIRILTQDVHPPLYYLILRFWTQCFGSSVAAIRSLSVVISLLAFPCIYWLCLELFSSSLVGWMAIALIAVSPFHVVYAQEARMYSLLTVEIFLSSVALLRAIRLKTKLAWGFYAITIGLGLNTHLFFIFVAMAHSIYVAITERFRFNKVSISYLISACAGFLTFLPWSIVILTNVSSFQDSSAWITRQTPSLISFFNQWSRNLSYGFVDFFFVFTYYPASPLNLGYGKFIIPMLLILVTYSLYVLFRETPERVWLFIFILVGTTAIILIMVDLFFGGYRSTVPRYLTASYLGIQLAVAYLLARPQTNHLSVNIRQQKFWVIVTVILISGAILSNVISSQLSFWWNKGSTSYDHIKITRLINQTTDPLLISRGISLSLCHMLNPKVSILSVDDSNIPIIPNNFSDVFLFNPSAEIGSKLMNELRYQVEIVYKGRKENLWQLIPIKYK